MYALTPYAHLGNSGSGLGGPRRSAPLENVYREWMKHGLSYGTTGGLPQGGVGGLQLTRAPESVSVECVAESGVRDLSIPESVIAVSGASGRYRPQESVNAPLPSPQQSWDLESARSSLFEGAIIEGHADSSVNSSGMYASAVNTSAMNRRHMESVMNHSAMNNSGMNHSGMNSSSHMANTSEIGSGAVEMDATVFALHGSFYA